MGRAANGRRPSRVSPEIHRLNDSSAPKFQPRHVVNILPFTPLAARTHRMIHKARSSLSLITCRNIVQLSYSGQLSPELHGECGMDL